MLSCPTLLYKHIFPSQLFHFRPSLIRTIRGMMMGRYVVLFVLKVLMAGSSFAGPVLLNQILLWYTSCICVDMMRHSFLLYLCRIL
jgi:hypothetical protein